MTPRKPPRRHPPPPTEPALPRPEARLPAGAQSPAHDVSADGSDDPGTTRIAAGPPRVGSLELLELLGAGGMGEVWKARDPELDRLVAVKLLAPAPRGSGYDERFRREARAAAAVAHPNVAQVYSAGVHEGRLYYVMELVRGRSLAELLAARGPLSSSHCVGWLREACAGLRAAQQAGIIHRDVKPSNLMVEDGGSGLLKLVDFGLARRVETDVTLTRDGSVMGTPRYMSPEQAHGDELDHRSDIYSLGATFYHLLSGKPPFAGRTAMEVLRQHVTSPLAPLRQRNPAVPAPLAAVVERMLLKEPAARFQSYDEVLAALDGSGRAVERAPTARRRHSWQSSWNWVGRRGSRRWVAPALGLVLAALLVTAMSRWRQPTAPVAAQPPSPRPQTAGETEAAPAPSDESLGKTPTDSGTSSAEVGTGDTDPRSVTAKTLARLAAALLEDARARRPAPLDVDVLIASHGLDPSLGRDGWGSPLRIERGPIGGVPWLVSSGPDRRSRTRDDLLWLAGELRPLPPRPKAFGPEP